MQSRRPFLPELCASCTVDEMVSSRTASAVALAEPGGAPVSLSVPGVLIGPEGGWSPRELALAENLVGLGDGVLRVETAAVTAGALLCAMRCMAVAPPR
jgi:RsmE family RNA methyltransferase